jgi:hypothetical protein
MKEMGVKFFLVEQDGFDGRTTQLAKIVDQTEHR